MVHVVMLLLLDCGMVLQFLGQTLDVLARRTVAWVLAFDFRVDGLVQAAELQLLLLCRVEELLLGAGLGRVEVVVLLLLAIWRRRVLGHLRQHPVVHDDKFDRWSAHQVITSVAASGGQ